MQGSLGIPGIMTNHCGNLLRVFDRITHPVRKTEDRAEPKLGICSVALAHAKRDDLTDFTNSAPTRQARIQLDPYRPY